MGGPKFLNLVKYAAARIARATRCTHQGDIWREDAGNTIRRLFLAHLDRQHATVWLSYTRTSEFVNFWQIPRASLVTQC